MSTLSGEVQGRLEWFVMFFILFMQQKDDSNWAPFFKKTLVEAESLADNLIKNECYSSYYICQGLKYSHDFHSEELK